MTYREFLDTLGKVPYHIHPGGGELKEIVGLMMDLLDEADAEDTFGTQGWKYCVGLED